MIRQNALALNTQEQLAFNVVQTLLLLFWVLVLFVRLRLPDANQESAVGLVVFLVSAACCMAAWESALLARSWSVPAWVLRARLVPSWLWQQSLQHSLQSATRFWAVLAVGMVGVLLPAHAPLHGLTAIALLALVWVLALLSALAARGLLPRAWFAVFPLAGVLGFSSVIKFLNAMPAYCYSSFA